MLEYYYWSFGNKHQWNPNRNVYVFIQENALENVIWKLGAIVCRPQCVKRMQRHSWHWNIL